MMIKRCFAIVIAAVMMAALLSGCAADNSNTETEQTHDELLYLEAEGQTYDIGTDLSFEPFIISEDGELSGIDIELMQAIADEMGFSVEWHPLGFALAFSAMDHEMVDAVMAGASITEERERKYDFSNGYYECSIAVAVSPDSGYESLEDLRGSTVAVKIGTTGAAYAESIAREYGFEVAYYDNSDQLYDALANTDAAACFEDYPVIRYQILHEGLDMTIIAESDESFTYSYGLAVRDHDQAVLISAFNEGLRRIQENGTYDEIVSSYLR